MPVQRETVLEILQNGTEFFIRVARDGTRQPTDAELGYFIEQAVKCIMFLERRFGMNAEEQLEGILHNIVRESVLEANFLENLQNQYATTRQELIERRVVVTDGEILEIQSDLEWLSNSWLGSIALGIYNFFSGLFG